MSREDLLRKELEFIVIKEISGYKISFFPFKEKNQFILTDEFVTYDYSDNLEELIPYLFKLIRDDELKVKANESMCENLNWDLSNIRVIGGTSCENLSKDFGDWDLSNIKSLV